jgi:hypothetical protein
MAEYSNVVISISAVGVGVVLGCFLGSYFIAGCAVASNHGGLSRS